MPRLADTHSSHQQSQNSERFGFHDSREAYVGLKESKGIK